MKLIQEGPRDAKLICCGEAPGEKEAATGRPFIGGSGMLLDEIFRKVGINRSTTFITNVCHVQPPGNSFDWFFKKENQMHLALGALRLKRDIEEIRPNLVVALGAQPLRVLTGKIGIDKWRGSILESTLVPGQKVIATYHPAHCLRTWDYKAVVEIDMLRIAEEMQFPEIILPQREYILNPDLPTRAAIGREMANAEWLAVDIETKPSGIPGAPDIRCIGFSDRPDRAMVVPIRTAADVLFMREMLASPAKKVFQTGQYDATVMLSHGIETNKYAWDTMYAHHAIYTECAGADDEISMLVKKGKRKVQTAIRKGLGFQASIYTKEPFYKDDGKLWEETGDIIKFWTYNGRDAAVTREARDAQDKQIDELQALWEQFHGKPEDGFTTRTCLEHEMALIEPLMSMTRHGIKVNPDTHRQLLEQYTMEVARLQKFLEATAGDLANAKSPKQMQELLYVKLGLPKQSKRRGDGSYTTTADKDAINKLAEKYPHPVLLTILEIRERRDLIERYLNTAYGTDGRMRCSWDGTGTRTGRLASRTSLDGTGGNLQNQPEKLRMMYEADEGCVFVYRDYSQAEARVVAYLAREDGLIELFSDPSRDVHKENASRIFGVSVADVTEEQRYNAKRGVHAFNYGMEDDKFVKVVNQAFRDTGFRMNHAMAKRIREGYFMLYPGIKENFWREVENDLRHGRMLRSHAVGRIRMFFGRMDDKLVRDAYSFKPQSTVGDLCCRALIRCYRDIELGRPDLNAKLLLNVHDSLLMQCPIRHAVEVSHLMGEAMDIPLTIYGKTFKIPTDAKIGYNWGSRPKGKPELNPRGLVSEKLWLSEAA